MNNDLHGTVNAQQWEDEPETIRQSDKQSDLCNASADISFVHNETEEVDDRAIELLVIYQQRNDSCVNAERSE